MKTKTWMCAGLVFALAGCAGDEPQPDDVTSRDDLGTHLAASGKADGNDVRKLADGRVVFYGDIAHELAVLGEVSPRTKSEEHNGVRYAQSPFAYCAHTDTDAACVSYLPNATVEGDDLVFGGAYGSSTEAQKAYALGLAMYYGGYEQARTATLDLFSDGSPLSCQYGSEEVMCSVSTKTAPAAATLSITFDGLPVLGDDFVYEGWLIVDGAPVSAGRFVSTDFFELAVDKAFVDATAYILTIEPAVGDDPAPSATHLVGGVIVDGEAELTVDFGGALGTDFSRAAGSFILAAPSAMDSTGAFDDKGIWYLEPTGPAPSLELPELGDGWVYEGWVVTEDGPVSTGRFSTASGADSDGAGPAAGPGMTPPFPGQDFVNPPVSLPGHLAVISVEPQPDDSPKPFAIKPLVGAIEDAGAGVAQPLTQNGEALPTGRAVLR